MLLPVHPNPRIAPRIRHRLGGHAQFTLVAPMDYREFITAAANAALSTCCTRPIQAVESGIQTVGMASSVGVGSGTAAVSMARPA